MGPTGETGPTGFTSPTGFTGPGFTGPTGPPGTITFVYSSVRLSYTGVANLTVTEATGDTGVSTTSDIWLQGFAQTGTKVSTPVTYLFFDPSFGLNWTVRMGIIDPYNVSPSVDYIISYYSK